MSEQKQHMDRPTRGRFRFREHVIGPDRRPEAEPHTYRMQCATCEESGPITGDCEDGTEWAVRHLKANPHHLAYREHITRPYRAEPGAWL
ncbi:hypothetical protein ACQUSR_11700 [Streptomyces sp. P1-3]|uniref:DUF7848 domain-containing protein n=1 Tax=Streptomyces sp. P1-3 TaxID=3421658 RepID=UPI003D36FC48